MDYIGSWGPAICGHAHPEVISALQEAIEKGTSFGAPCALENTLAEMVIEAVPSVEMVRFVNSGTEACMSMLRLIRAFTGRDKIIKFEGCYHGHADMFLVKAGSGVATLGLPDSPGVPRSTTANTLTAPYNDLESVKQLFAENPDAIAGVILEPIVGNAGFIHIFIAINIPGIRPFDPIEHDGLSADRLEGAHRRAHAAGHQSLGRIEYGLGVAGVQSGSSHGDGSQRAVANRATS